MRNVSTSVLAVAAAVAGSLHAAPVSAAPPGDFSIAVERLFGFSRATSDFDPGGSLTTSSISVLAKPAGDPGYSVPRLAFDFLADSGLSFGAALGFQSLEVEEQGTTALLLVARVGYFARVNPDFGLWPRAGLTHFSADFEDDDDGTDATALTLEVPLEFLVSRGVALTITPHADIGISGSAGDADRKITEIGIQFGGGVFF